MQLVCAEWLMYLCLVGATWTLWVCACVATWPQGPSQRAGLAVCTGAWAPLLGRAASANAYSGPGTWPAPSFSLGFLPTMKPRLPGTCKHVLPCDKSNKGWECFSRCERVPDDPGLLPLTLLAPCLLVSLGQQSLLPVAAGEKESNKG